MEPQRFTSGYVGAVAIAAIAYGLSWAIIIVLGPSELPKTEIVGAVGAYIGLFFVFAIFTAFIPFCLARYLAAKHSHRGVLFHLMSGALIGGLNSILVGGINGGVEVVQCTFSGVMGSAFYWWRTGRHTLEISDVRIGTH